MALFAEDIPEHHRIVVRLPVGDAYLIQAGGQLLRRLARFGDAGQVALHIGHKHRHANLREGLGHFLQGDGLAGAGGAGDQSVTVGHTGQQKQLRFFGTGNQQGCAHVHSSVYPRSSIGESAGEKTRQMLSFAAPGGKKTILFSDAYKIRNAYVQILL